MKARVINRGHSYYGDVQDPANADNTIRKASFATHGQVIEVSDEEFKRGEELDALARPDDTVLVGKTYRLKQDGSDDSDTTVTDVMDASDDELIIWLQEENPTIPEVVDAVGDDPENAQRALDAEESATGGEPRQGLVDKLEAIIDKSGEKQ